MPHAQDAVFNKNFFEDWKKVLKKDPPVGLDFFQALRQRLISPSVMVQLYRASIFAISAPSMNISKARRPGKRLCPLPRKRSSRESKTNWSRSTLPVCSTVAKRKLAISELNLRGCSKAAASTRKRALSRFESNGSILMDRTQCSLASSAYTPKILP